MALSAAFATTVAESEPTNANLASAGIRTGASIGADPTKEVSDFITVQSFTNFAAMTGAFAAAWGAARQVDAHVFGGVWLPLVLCLAFGAVSLIASDLGRDPRRWLQAGLIALVNSLVLLGAVVSTAGLAASVR
jgi:hypothetical protein